MRLIPFFVLMLGLVCAGHARVPPEAAGPALRRGEFFHREVTVANTSAAQYPNIDIGVGGPETAQGELFVPLTPEAFQYTNGKLTQDGRWTYSYDGENRLVAMEAHNLTGAPAASRQRLEFTYDYAGRRIRKIVKAFNATTQQFTTTELDEKYVYDGWNLLAIIDTATGNKKRTFMWALDLSQTEHEAGGVGGLLQVTDYSTSGGTSSHFAAYDGNGNVVGLVNASSGRMSALYEYGPFGEPLRATGPLAALNPIRFSSKFTDNESGLLYYGYRFYNPSTGRWLNRDPIEEAGGNNLYGFIGNDPLGYIDDSGLNGLNITLRPPPRVATYTYDSQGFRTGGGSSRALTPIPNLPTFNRQNIHPDDLWMLYRPRPTPTRPGETFLTAAPRPKPPAAPQVAVPGHSLKNIVTCAISPKRGFSNTTLGHETHEKFLDALTQLTGTRNNDWRMRTKPGQTGVDAEYIGPPNRNPGFDYAELKPYSPFSFGTFGNQLGNWNLPPGKTQLWFYNESGIIGSSGFNF